MSKGENRWRERASERARTLYSTTTTTTTIIQIVVGIDAADAGGHRGNIHKN
jgi:hypothetical protein